jgi:hypothetical protein
MAAGITIIYRERRGLSPMYRLDAYIRQGQAVLGVLGFGLGVASGLLGAGVP